MKIFKSEKKEKTKTDGPKKILIINTGSASKKYSVFEGGKKIYNAHFEMENGVYIVTEKIGEASEKSPISRRVFERSIERVLGGLINKKIIASKEGIDAAGIRIVAPGQYFLTHRIIDKEFLKMAKLALEKVPLHLGPALEEIKMFKKTFGDDVVMIGVSDSVFHNTIPAKAKLYAIPIQDSRDLGLQKFGYHGISIQSVISQAEKILGALPAKVVVCHIGGGVSVTAVKDGKSMDTSMGFTPLDGLVMATRVGEIDPGAVIYLADKLGMRMSKLEEYFNEKCGLLGLSGKSGDVRDLIEAEKTGDKDSSLALDIYAERLKKYIGSMSAVLGGIDLLIFAGTVGERSFIMRGRICEGLQFLGIDLDMELNNKSEGVEVELSAPGSKTKILVVKTDEMEEIAKSVEGIL
ncbi:MAG: acetate/propionate family kinase [bacterium]